MHFQDLSSITCLPVAPNSVILGGRQSKIVQMDLVTQKEQRLVCFFAFFLFKKRQVNI